MTHILSYKNAPPLQEPLPGSLYDLALAEAKRDGASEESLPRYFEPETAPGKKPVGILFIHGYCASPLQGIELAKKLFAQGYAVYLPRLKGHGTTPQDLRHRKWAEWHRDVELGYQFIRTRCDKVYVLGLSLGGTLGYLLATEYPEIAGVITNGAIFKVAHWGARSLRTIEAILEHVFRTDLGIFHESLIMPKVDIPQDELHYSYNIYPLRSTYQILELADHVRERLPAVHCPVLVIQSPADNVVHRDCPDIIMDNISSLKKEVLWYGDKHISVVHPAEDITKKILDFIAE